MKEITIRDFQLKAAKYLKDMPLVLTRYGRPVATLLPYEEETVNLEHEISKSENIDIPSPVVNPAIASDNSVQESTSEEHVNSDPFNVYQKEFRECQEHLSPGLNYECFLTSYKDIDGTIVWTKWLCPTCFETLLQKVKRYGGNLTPKN